VLALLTFLEVRGGEDQGKRPLAAARMGVMPTGNSAKRRVATGGSSRFSPEAAIGGDAD